MEINSLRCSLSTITDIVFFLWNRHGREILFFFTQRPFLTFVVFLSLHDTWLTTRGRRGFIVCFVLCLRSLVVHGHLHERGDGDTAEGANLFFLTVRQHGWTCPRLHGNAVFCSFEQSDVGFLPIQETQKSSHWNEK